MVATQVLISLCVYGLTAAAPQLGRLNQDVIVNDVVVALQPSIAAAVANALRGAGGGSATGFAAGSGNSAGFSSSGFSSSTGFSSGSSSSSSGFSGQSSGFAAGGGGGASGGAAAAEPTVRPEYNYQFNVADDEEQTYITQQEARDGDQVRGQYAYVDPNGALVTVNYEAGPMGYTQTVDTQEGFVQVKNVAKNTQQQSSSSSSSGGFNSNAATGFTSNAAGFSSNSASSNFNGFSSGSSSSQGVRGGQVSTTSTVSAIDENALINQIIAVLQPQISSAVNSAVRQQQQTVTRTVQRTTAGGLRQVGGAVAGDRLTPLFGN